MRPLQSKDNLFQVLTVSTLDKKVNNLLEAGCLLLNGCLLLKVNLNEHPFYVQRKRIRLELFN